MIFVHVSVSPLKSINKHQPEFICIEGATKEFLGTYLAPDDFIESQNQDRAVLNQLEETNQEKSHQELIQVINKTLKSVDNLDKLGESDSDSEESDNAHVSSLFMEKVSGGHRDAEDIAVSDHANRLIISHDLSNSDLESHMVVDDNSPIVGASLKHTPPKLQTDVAVGNLLETDAGSCAIETIKQQDLSAPIDTDITCQITLPKVETVTKPSLKDAFLSAERLGKNDGEISQPVVTKRKRKLNTTDADKKTSYKRERNLPCPFCDILLKDYDSVYDHLKNSHKDEETYAEVIQDVKGKMRVTCSECNSELCNKDQLTVHIRQVHNAGPDAKCPHCDATFRSMDYLKNHVKRIHLDKDKDKKFLCHLCPASFRCKSYLTNHVKLVHSENAKDSYRCNLCGHTCSHEKYLKNHYARVHRDRHFYCKYCDRPFKTSANMLRHVRLIHEKQDNPKPFECEECGKRFSLKANMTEHVKSTHYIEFKFQCEVCKCGFRRKKQLESHKCMARIIQHGEGNESTSIIMLPCGSGINASSNRAEASIMIAEEVTESTVNTGDAVGYENVEYQYIIATPELLKSLNQTANSK